MSNPYVSFTQGQYSEADIMDELRRYGGGGPVAGGGYMPPPAQLPAQTPMMQTQMMQSAALGQNPFAIGAQPDAQSMPAAGATAPSPAASPEDYRNSADPYGIYDSNASTQYAEPSNLYEGAVDVRFSEQRVVGERLLEIRNQIVNSVKPIYTFEKIVEVPQVIVRETTREVPKPQIVERIIEVPKNEIRERTYVGPPSVQFQEQIVEVPQVVVEERIVHVPKREIQERLIEVPKVEFVERIEYEDFVEYREVPVDKIVEVPEIEYRVREVEQFVPQTYIQEYYVDKYVETPITQVQEVERVEHVPMRMNPNASAAMAATASAEMAAAAHAVQQGGAAGGQQYVTMSFSVPSHLAAAYSQVVPISSPGSPQVTFPTQSMVQPQVVNSYMSYDPSNVHMMGQFVLPQEPMEMKPAGTQPASSSSLPASLPVGSQFLVPHGSVQASMHGSATPPMAPGSAAAVPATAANPFASMGVPDGAAVNPFASMGAPGQQNQSVPVF